MKARKKALFLFVFVVNLVAPLSYAIEDNGGVFRIGPSTPTGLFFSAGSPMEGYERAVEAIMSSLLLTPFCFLDRCQSE